MNASASSHIDPVEFGRIIGHLESIEGELRDLKARTTWRLDNLETRIETLEKADSQAAPWRKLVERAFVALAGIGAGVTGYKFLGGP